MHFLLTRLVPLCTQVFCILTYPWSRRRDAAAGSLSQPDRGVALLPPNARPRVSGARQRLPLLAEFSHGERLEARCTSPAEGLPHHGTGEDRGCAAQGRTRSPAQEHQELLQVPPRRSGTGSLRFLRPPGRGRRARTTQSGQGASLPAWPGAAVTDPARPAGATAPNKRPGGGPETSRGRGSAAPSARGANPSPADPYGLRLLVPPTRLSPPRRALQRARRGEGKPGEKDAMQQLRRHRGTEGGMEGAAQ